MTALHQLTIHEAAQLLRQRKISSVELTRAILSRIATVEPVVKACITVTEELAMDQAKVADECLAKGNGHYLTGIPILIKDNISTKNIRTTCASRILETYVPPFDATVVEKLKDHRAVIVGKTNMDEFAMGSSTENSAFHPTYNPWDLTRVPGGSSGGSAAAVAADEAMAALGSDTGGSIRQPAGFCNIVGLKPTYGRVSRYGLVAFASSLDQIGPLTKDVTDCAILLNAISGYDPRDSTSINRPVPDYTKALIPDITGIRLGVPKEYFAAGLQDEVRTVMDTALDKLQSLGAKLEWLSMPHTEYALPVYYIIAPSEASANLARYDGVKYGFSYREANNIWETTEKTRQFGFGPEVKRRIMLGTYALSAGYYDAYYLKAQKVRTLIRRDFDAAFEKCDALVTPTSPTVPFKIGQKIGDPLQMYLSDICTLSVNIAGIPAISIPAGFANGLPVGMQIIGRAFDEETILRIAYTYEQATDWHKRRPMI
ncbi:MAG: Asp-tRNA(Asn)/Glu-tRNA(Gln) amidotransferase subunit GatA [Dehalococcoidia bacterium]|nr:Asp-tRNA(Asn)/Glu-tRNA(Gln) amidotransferase subunit GatA [Dehalococcoidia bacterium]